jgi:hypothetical protein
MSDDPINLADKLAERQANEHFERGKDGLAPKPAQYLPRHEEARCDASL